MFEKGHRIGRLRRLAIGRSLVAHSNIKGLISFRYYVGFFGVEVLYHAATLDSSTRPGSSCVFL